MNKKDRVRSYINQFKVEENQTFIVTGANSGLGFSTTKHLISLGAEVVMACRNLNKAEDAKRLLLKSHPKAKILILEYDQASFESIDQFVDIITNKYHHFSGLILNAGIFNPKKNLYTKDGFSLTVGTNYLGVYYLLKKLQDQNIWDINFQRRIVFIGSLSWHKINQLTKAYITDMKTSSAIKSYAHSKTLLGSLAYQLAKHEHNDDLYLPSYVKVLLMHPGVTSTNIVASDQSSYPKWFSRLAKKALRIFVHSTEVASLGILKLLLDSKSDEDMMVVPRGLFQISGYPTNKKYPKNLTHIDRTLISITQDIIDHKHRGVI